MIKNIEEVANKYPYLNKVYFTGHSLGGTMAVLASYFFNSAFDLKKLENNVYTYGMPRVGNFEFA